MSDAASHEAGSTPAAPNRTAYAEYARSSVSHLGALPSHWRVLPLKRQCLRSALYGANETADAYVDDGVRFLRTTDITDDGRVAGEGAVYVTDEAAADYLLNDGDLLLSRSGTLGRSLCFETRKHGTCAYAGYLVRFVPGPQLVPRYAFWFTKSLPFADWLRVSVIQSTIGNVNGQKFANMQMSAPPSNEQHVIADFLDRETEKIDALVAKKQRLIDLLEEKRGALISHAVTKGVDPDVPMKDSGWSLVGDVPRHWHTPRLGLCCSLLTDGTHAPPPWSPGQDRLLSARNLVNGEFVLRDDDRTMSAEDARLMPASCIARQGDVLLVVVGGTTGKSAVAENVHDVAVQRSVAILRPRLSLIQPEYLRLWLSSRPVQESIGRVVDQYAAQPGIYLQDVGALPAAVPPLAEQSHILARVNDSISRDRRLASLIARQMAKLDEYRCALITAAVTGQIDVREYASEAN